MKFDFHSHILPGIDDGSRSVSESIEMLKMESEQGVDTVLATPHFYADADTPDQFLRRRHESEQALREELQKHTGLPEISIAAEVHYFRGMSESESLSELTFGNKRFVLLEMPMIPWTGSMYKEIEQIYVKQGITPVIAHIDRYLRPFHTNAMLERLAAMPVFVQANASFFASRSTRSLALRMVSRDQIHLLGSDCHNTTSRPPNLGKAYDLIEKKLGKKYVDGIAGYAEEILAGEISEK